MASPDPASPIATPAAVCTAAKIRRLARRVTQIYDEALSPFGLTIGQFGVLNSLSRRSGIGVGVLADRLASDASTVSRLLKPLQSAGLIVLDRDPDDRRAKSIRLTDAGHATRRTAAAGWMAAQSHMATALGDGRLASLRFIVDDAHAHLR